jgi:thiol-disulfide isomerase/thioredoxin
MRKLVPLFLLVIAAATLLSATPQSGRRITRSASAPTAPIQPPLNPEPEVKTASAPTLAESLVLPESVFERRIRALDNNNFRLSDFHGKVIVINLWASWCGPCRREVPEYEKVRKAYADREVEFIGLTTEDPSSASDRVRSFARDMNFGFRLGWADRELARALMHGTGIPQTLVLDTSGRIVSHWNGYSPGRSGDRLKQTIDQALP